jgi:bacteriocin biosynthesis cyclodehydratase domain-containing protein
MKEQPMNQRATNLRIKRHYSIIAHSPDIVELRHGVWNPISFTLTDEDESGYLFRLLTRLDGSLSPRELAKAENVPRAEVEALLDHLIELGVVESGPSSSLDYYLDHIVPTLQPVHRPTVHRPVLLLGDPDMNREIQRYLESSLKDTEVTALTAEDPVWLALSDNDPSWLTSGIAFQEKVGLFETWKNKLIVFTMKVINPIQLRTLNRIVLEHRVPWIHAALDGPFLFVGPTFVPHRSPCYECFETRVMMNLRENASYQRYKQTLVKGGIKNGELPIIEPALVGLLASHTALEALNFVLTDRAFTMSKVLAIYLPTMEFTFNEVFRVPSCKACSPVAERDDKELYFDLRALIHER